MHPMIREVNPEKLDAPEGTGAIGDFHMGYEKLKAILDDKEPFDEGAEWQLTLWNGMAITIYPEDYDRVEYINQARHNSRWHIGADSRLVHWGNRWSKIYNTIMHYILQDGPKNLHKTDEHDVIRMILSAKDT